MLNLRPWRLELCGAGAIAVLALTACSKPAAEVKEEPTPVRVEAATAGPATPAISVNGLVTNKEEIRLSFKVTGVIRQIAVDEGQSVKAGQALAQIELTEIDSQVDQARFMEDKARRDLERAEKLQADRLISLEQLQDIRTQAQMSRAQLESAQFNRNHSTIVAPVGGTILRKLAEARELIPAGQPVLVMGAQNKGYVVKVALADREIVQLKLGDPAQIRMDAWPGQALAGKVTEIASAADTRSGLFPVEVRFETLPEKLVSGLVARVELYPLSSRSQTRTYVPIGAVVQGDGDRAEVFVVDGDGKNIHAKRRQVRVAFIAPQAIALEAGLQPGERVVTEGALYLEDGESIVILPAAAPSRG